MARKRYPVNGPITQGFGPGHPLDSGGYYKGQWIPHFNKGLDFGVPIGTRITAPVSGKVIRAIDAGDGWGLSVWVQDAQGVIHNFGHLSKSLVQKGATVQEGQEIALSGNSGRSSGPHLSYDIFKEGPNGYEYLDPDEYLETAPSSSTAAPTTGGTSMVKRLGTATLSQQQVMEMILRELEAAAAQNGLPKEFIHHALAVAYGESGFVQDALNDGSAFGTNEYSVGPWQINQKAHNVSNEQATDPVFSTRHRIPSLIAAWKDTAKIGDPVERQRQFHSKAQVSFVPSPQKAAEALEIAYQGMSGARVGEGTLPVGGVQPPGGMGTAARSVLPPAATDVDALEKLIQDQVATALSSNDPRAMAVVAQAKEALSVIRVIKGEASPDTIADIASRERITDINNASETSRLLMSLGSQMGINRENIQAEKENLNTRLAHDADQAAQNRAQQTFEKTGDWTIAREQLAQDQRQWEGQYGIDLQRLGIERQRLGLDEEISRGQLDVSRGRLALDRDIQEGGLAIDRDRLGIERERLGLEQQRGVREEKQAALSAMIDMIGVQIEAGQLSARGAEAALNALVDIYEATGGMEYPAGYEPGGAYQAVLGQIGGSYDERLYRVKPFPLDLAAMAKAGSQFDLSKAWGQAKDLLASSGFDTSQFAQPAPTQGAMPGQANPIFGSPTTPSPAGLPPAPAAQPAPTAGLPAQPGPSTPSFVPPQMQQAPATAQPTGMTAPGQDPNQMPSCGPGTMPVWNGQAWECRPDPTQSNPQAASAPPPAGLPPGIG